MGFSAQAMASFSLPSRGLGSPSGGALSSGLANPIGADRAAEVQPQMQPPYMLVAGCGPTVAAVGQQLQPHMLVAGQQLHPHMQPHYWWPCQSVSEKTHGSGPHIVIDWGLASCDL